MVNRIDDVGISPREDVCRAWPVSWSAVWVGALTSLAVLIVIGLIGVAVGAHLIGPSSRILSWREFGWLTLTFSVAGAFFSFVAGGWAAGSVAGTQRAESSILHGAIAWLVAVPLLLMLAWVGGSNILGSWYGGLAGTPSWTQAAAPKAAIAAENETTVTADKEAAKKEAEDAARATRNSALGALTALLLGLMGSVLGGWMASGESMSLGHVYRSHCGITTTTTGTPVTART